MLVEEFVEKFEDKEAYSSQSIYAPDERWNINQFKFGLRGEIEHNIARQWFDTYAKLLQQCYIVKNSLKKIQGKK